MTQEQIDKAIAECHWKNDVCGIDVCRGAVLPCVKTIERGECETLRELFDDSMSDWQGDGKWE